MPPSPRSRRARRAPGALQVLEAWLEYAQAQHTLDEAWALADEAGGDPAVEAMADGPQDQAVQARADVAELLAQAHAAGRFQAVVEKVLTLAKDGGATTHPFPAEALFDLRADLAYAHGCVEHPTGKAGQQASVDLAGVAATGLLEDVEALASDPRFVETLLATQALGEECRQARVLGVLPAAQAATLACDPVRSWDLALRLGKRWDASIPELAGTPRNQAGAERYGGYVIVVAGRYLIEETDQGENGDLETDWDDAEDAWEAGVDALMESMGRVAVVGIPTEPAIAALEAMAGQLTQQLFLGWGTAHAQEQVPDLVELAWVTCKQGRLDLVGRFEDGTLQRLQGALKGQMALLRDRIGAHFDFPIEVLEDARALAQWEANGGEMGVHLPGFVATPRPPTHRLH